MAALLCVTAVARPLGPADTDPFRLPLVHGRDGQ
jgi:hypothetical protein